MEAVRLFLAGDVMTGRGVDQILPSPGAPGLREEAAGSALTYVELAEAANGPIPHPADFSWPWGEALRLLDAARPDVRLINVETSITRSDDYAAGKGIHYRMHPGNLPCLAALRPDVCALANNHVLDFGSAGLGETVAALGTAGLRPIGAGLDDREAWSPAVLDIGTGRRMAVWSVATGSSGVPGDWAAETHRPGVARLPAVSDADSTELAERIRRTSRPGDLVVVSIHWGSNWGYQVPDEHVRFAHRLVDAGVHVVHGHSSHHARPVEVYRGRLVLYGCGDLVNDYEGIGGYEPYRDDLRLLYLADLEPGTGQLVRLCMVPMRSRRLRLVRASPADAAWLADVLTGISRPFGARIAPAADGTLTLQGL